MPVNDTARIKIFFQDRGGQTAYTQWYIRSDAPITTLILRINDTFLPRIQSISDGIIVGYSIIFSYQYHTFPSPGPDSNVKRAAVLIFRNVDGDYTTLKIVSPKLDIFDTDGELKGIRVSDRINVELGDMFSTLPFLSQEGLPFGTMFITGGLAI